MNDLDEQLIALFTLIAKLPRGAAAPLTDVEVAALVKRLWSAQDSASLIFKRKWRDDAKNVVEALDKFERRWGEAIEVMGLTDDIQRVAAKARTEAENMSMVFDAAKKYGSKPLAHAVAREARDIYESVTCKRATVTTKERVFSDKQWVETGYELSGPFPDFLAAVFKVLDIGGSVEGSLVWLRKMPRQGKILSRRR